MPTVVRPGETLSSTYFERRAGGKGANQAAAVAKAGGQVKLIGAVGDDGTRLLHGLKSIGVDTSDVVVSDAVGFAYQSTPLRRSNSPGTNRQSNYTVNARRRELHQ